MLEAWAMFLEKFLTIFFFDGWFQWRLVVVILCFGVELVVWKKKCVSYVLWKRCTFPCLGGVLGGFGSLVSTLVLQVTV